MEGFNKMEREYLKREELREDNCEKIYMEK